MVESLRQQVREVIGKASGLDAVLAGAKAVPDLPAARVLVELAKVGEKLDKLTVQAAAALAKAPPEDGDTLKARRA